MFTRSSAGVWSQQGPKLVGTGAIGTYIEQGSSVSLSADGNTAIVGGRGDDFLGGAEPYVVGVGAAWVFTRSAGVWTQQGSKLVGTGYVGNSTQGSSVAVSGDGYSAIVGGPNDDGNSTGFGVGATWAFSQPPVFAGTPGKANCHGQSVSALSKRYGGLNNAGAALGYSSVSALQDAILAYCQS